MKKILILILLLPILALLTGSATPTSQEPIWTNNQIAYHEIADYARSLGCSEDSEIIKTLQKMWQDEQLKLNIIAKVISKEAGNCPWLHRIAVGQVVLNRTKHPSFPDTVFDVVNQSSRWTDTNGNVRVVYQYSPSYCYGFEGIDLQYYKDAKFVLDDNATDIYVPSDIIWQAQFPQGRETWWISYVDTGWFRSTTYFCR